LTAIIIVAAVVGPRHTLENDPVSRRSPAAAPGVNRPAAQNVKASELLGAAAMTAQGQRLATVEDLLLEDGGPAAPYAVLAFDSEAPWTLVPLGETSMGSAGELTVPAGLDEAARVTPRELESADRRGSVTRWSSLAGTPVIDAFGDSVGVVTDVVFETAPWRARYAILQGHANLDARLFAIPMAVLLSPAAVGATSAASQGVRILDVDRSTLLTLSHFATWPDVNDTASVRRIERGWGEIFLESGRGGVSPIEERESEGR